MNYACAGSHTPIFRDTQNHKNHNAELQWAPQASTGCKQLWLQRACVRKHPDFQALVVWQIQCFTSIFFLTTKVHLSSLLCQRPLLRNAVKQTKHFSACFCKVYRQHQKLRRTHDSSQSERDTVEVVTRSYFLRTKCVSLSHSATSRSHGE